jgi:hypothetical protein
MSDSAVPPTLAGPAEIQRFLRLRARGAWWFFVALAIIALAVAVIAGKGQPAALLAAGGFIVATAIFTGLAKHKLGQAWKGEVVHKEVREIRHRKDDDSAVRQIEYRFLIHVRIETGATRKVQVPRELFERYYAEGQRLVKISGLGMPVHATPPPGAASACPNCGGLQSPEIAICPRCKCPLPDPTRF